MQLSLFLDLKSASPTYSIRSEHETRWVVCAKFIKDHFDVTAELISVQVERKAFKGSKKITCSPADGVYRSVRINGHVESHPIYLFIEENFPFGTYYVKVTPA